MRVQLAIVLVQYQVHAWLLHDRYMAMWADCTDLVRILWSKRGEVSKKASPEAPTVSKIVCAWEWNKFSWFMNYKSEEK